MKSRKRIAKALKRKDQLIVTLIVMLVLYWFLLIYFKPDLILSETTTSGGDTPSHHYLASYLRDYLLPRGELIGWSTGWYAGFPLFQFYFLPPYLLMALLSYLIPFVVAFKLVTVLGIFLLPVCTLFSMKLMKFEFPIPLLAAIFTIPFLFFEAYTFYGGNIPSTLAGEFSYSLSLAIMVLLFGSLYAGLQIGKNLRRNALLAALMLLTHLYTSLVFFLSSLVLLKKDWRKSLSYLLKVGLIAFLLASFWLLPLLFKVNFTSSLGWLKITDFAVLLEPRVLIFAFLAVLGLVMAAKNRDLRVFYLATPILISLTMFFFLPSGILLNARFLPFSFVFLFMVAAYGLGKIAKIFIKDQWAFVLFVLVLVLLLTNYSIKFIPDWIKWNYEGFESKSNWRTLDELFGFLKALPPGRVMHEYTPDHDIYGSPRTLESIPYFTGKPTMEGLLIESALTSPYHFWLQSKLASRPSCPISYMGCSRMNVTEGLRYLEMFNVKYFVASTEKLKNATRYNQDFILLKKIDEFDVYEINHSGKYVVQPKYRPVLVETKDWRTLSFAWFKDMKSIDVPVAFVEKIEAGDLNHFNVTKTDSVNNLVKIPNDSDCHLEETVENEQILIKTDCINQPLLVKVSYFPNWQVEGADKVYLVSPAFMMIFPSQENVKLYYGNTVIDNLGFVFSVIGLLILLLYRKLEKLLTFP